MKGHMHLLCIGGQRWTVNEWVSAQTSNDLHKVASKLKMPPFTAREDILTTGGWVQLTHQQKTKIKVILSTIEQDDTVSIVDLVDDMVDILEKIRKKKARQLRPQIKDTKRMVTKELCSQFGSNPLVNPLTRRAIKLNGPTHQKLSKECETLKS